MSTSNRGDLNKEKITVGEKHIHLFNLYQTLSASHWARF